MRITTHESGTSRSIRRQNHRPRRRLATGALALALLAAPLSLLGASQAAEGGETLRKQPAGATIFRLSSFNLLGAGHTDSGERKGWASGATRMKWAVQVLDDNGINVVGFQEMQQPQYDVFHELAGSRFGIFPGNQLTTAAMANSIAWRRDTWTLLRKETIQIPYFDGNLIRMPYVLLQNKQTGQQAWFFNTHNPADAHGPAQKWRDQAVAKEIDLVNGLREQYPGVPVFVTGDMNDRDKFFCPMTGNTELLAANGGASTAGGTVENGGCTMPEPSRVDWVLGTSDMNFTGYTALHDELVQKTTDHFVIYADANIPPPSVQESPVTRVLVLSVEGLRPSAIRKAGEAGTPVLHRLMGEGASTLNARTEVERTTTLPNVVGMLTGRRVNADRGGHGVRADRDTGLTVQAAAGRYVSSTFDIVHNFGLSTALFSSQPRMALVDRSWDDVNGGTDPYGLDDGRDKINRFVSTTDDHELVDRLTAMLSTSPKALTVAQLSLLDDVGRTSGYASQDLPDDADRGGRDGRPGPHHDHLLTDAGGPHPRAPHRGGGRTWPHQRGPHGAGQLHGALHRLGPRRGRRRRPLRAQPGLPGSRDAPARLLGHPADPQRRGGQPGHGRAPAAPDPRQHHERRPELQRVRGARPAAVTMGG